MADSSREIDRTHRAYLIRRRHELLAPIRAIAELVEILLAEPEAKEVARIATDLATIRTTAGRMEALIGSTMSATEDATKALNHDLRSLLTIVINYGDELHRTVCKVGLPGIRREVDQIRSLAKRALALVDSTVTQLRSPGGAEAFDDVQAYLDRAGLSSEDEGCLDADLPNAEPGLILVADDSEPILELLCQQLRGQGHEVIPARDGQELLMKLGSRPFDLILTDLEMPRVNGFQVLERLKADPRLSEIPVIVISGHGELDGIAHCIKRGAEDYLPKPFNRTILKARVDSCLEKKRLRDRHELQRRRYDELLHAILPGPIVAELAATDTVRPVRREDVAVLFADVVGFTTYCDRLHDRPEVVVQHLRRLFEAWEEIAAASGVQKIKTIGDAFMAAAGLLEDAANPVLDCVYCGLKMIQATQALRDDEGNPLGWDLRVGIEIGPVVAGVLGRKQSLYDLWGDTVNVAARLESHGDRGCVNLSTKAWLRVADRFPSRGMSTRRVLKGKPEPVEIFHLDPVNPVRIPGCSNPGVARLGLE
jgi:adenylate cyclase